MILSASRRTDIPCYYAGWFINRLKAGYAMTRNPMNHSQLGKINITPEIVDCIVFWTKDAKNMIPYLKTIDKMGYNYYFQFTLNPYDNLIEKNLRSKKEIINTFTDLGKLLGRSRVLWRYDPVVLNDTLTVNYHKENFKFLCEKLYQYTESVTISYVDVYPKLKTSLVREIKEDEINELSEFFGKTAKEFGLVIKACCERAELSVFGIKKASCIDRDHIEKICGYKLKIQLDKNQRRGCGCVESTDIGAYNSSRKCNKRNIYEFTVKTEGILHTSTRSENNLLSMLLLRITM